MTRKTTKKRREFVGYTGIDPSTGAPAFIMTKHMYRPGRAHSELSVYRREGAARERYIHVRKVRIIVEQSR